MAEGSSQLKRKAEESSQANGVSKKKPPGHWSQGLLASMTDPELVVESDDICTVIKDKYPKAKHHFLILPKDKIPNLKSLKPNNIDLLKHLHKVGENIIKKTDSKRQFRMGYHAVPSMSHLHLHVISQDFDSPCLKNKKHWNSFTTDYFVDSKDVMKKLEKHGQVHFDSGEFGNLLKEDLRCHVCKKTQKNIPILKTHIKTHDYTT